MNYDQLEDDLANAPAIKLLKSDSAALIMSFLYQQFKQKQRLIIPFAELAEQLEAELEALNAHFPDRFPRSAQTYLTTWANEQHQFIRLLAAQPGRNEQPAVELTADAERALSWLQEMHAQPFVGTESRFLLVLQMIENIVHRTTEDPQQRLAQLEQQRDQLQQQIDEIRQTGKVDDLYSARQLRERFFETTALARQLLRDFRLVEDRFREIARAMQEKQLQAEAHKGAFVAYVLDADAELKASDQGHSFYAFWDFLMAPSQHERLYTLLDEFRRLPDLQAALRTDDLLAHLPAYLIAAGEQVVQSNYRLAEQLRRILDEQARAESRRVRELALHIQQQAHQLKHTMPDESVFLELEGVPEVTLVMERGLWEPTQSVPVAAQPLLAHTDDLNTLDVTPLYTQFFVDEAPLRDRITAMLTVREEVTLAELLHYYPLGKGLSELLTYCAIAAKYSQHVIDITQHETVPLLPPSARTEEMRVVTLPKVLYRRRLDEK
jgi:hypothetical protein